MSQAPPAPGPEAQYFPPGKQFAAANSQSHLAIWGKIYTIFNPH